MNRKRKSQLQLACFAVILIAFGAAVSYFIFSFGGEDQESADVSTTNPTDTSADSPPSKEVKIFEIPEDFDPKPIDGYSWELINGYGSMYLPKHPEHGPITVEPVPTGFARTPEGAALTAAYAFGESFGLSEDEQFDLFAKNHITGPGLEDLLSMRGLLAEADDQVFVNQRSSIVGWDIESYTEDKAVVTLYLVDNGALGADKLVGIEVYYVDELWKVYVSDGEGETFVSEKNFLLADKNPDVNLSGGSIL